MRWCPPGSSHLPFLPQNRAETSRRKSRMVCVDHRGVHLFSYNSHQPLNYRCRLGVGARIPESTGTSSSSRQTARLKDHLTKVNGRKHARDDRQDVKTQASDDEDESRAGAIRQKKAKANAIPSSKSSKHPSLLHVSTASSFRGSKTDSSSQTPKSPQLVSANSIAAASRGSTSDPTSQTMSGQANVLGQESADESILTSRSSSPHKPAKRGKKKKKKKTPSDHEALKPLVLASRSVPPSLSESIHPSHSSHGKAVVIQTSHPPTGEYIPQTLHNHDAQLDPF
jgi:hypothetical protein